MHFLTIELQLDNINDQPETFIHRSIERQEENAVIDENKLELPTTSNGELYSIHFCGPGQKEILARVLMKLREWVELPSRIETNHETNKFAPLRMTVSGEAGSGKSVLIYALVTVVRSMFATKIVQSLLDHLVPLLSMPVEKRFIVFLA